MINIDCTFFLDIIFTFEQYDNKMHIGIMHIYNVLKKNTLTPPYKMKKDVEIAIIEKFNLYNLLISNGILVPNLVIDDDI